MADQEIGTIWATVQEFVRGLQRQDPTIRRWIAPQSDVDLLLDLYGEAALLTLLKDYLEKERLVLLRSSPLSAGKGAACRVEFAWLATDKNAPTAEDRVTVQMRRVRRKWLAEKIWPSSLEELLTVDQARAAVTKHGEQTSPAVLFVAGMLDLPLEGCGELDDVETIFVLAMDEHSFSPQELIAAIRLWRDFRQEEQPAYHKPAILAAAVHYIFSLLGLYGDSQESIAAYYGVTPGSLSSRFRRIRNRLQLVYADPRYTVLEEGTAELKASCREMGLPWPTPLRRYLEDQP